MIVTSEFELSRVAAPNLPLSPKVYNSDYHEQLNNVLRLYFNQLDKILAQLRTDGAIDPSNINVPNGLFFNTADQTLAAVNTGYPITFNQTYLNNYVALQSGSTSKIQVAVAGVYNFQLSAQLKSTNASAKDVQIWIKRGTTTIGYSGHRYTVEGSDNHMNVVWIFDIDLAANEYGVYWIYPFLGGLTPCWLSFEWAALDVGANAYWQVYNFATGKYYDQAASGWTPAITYNVAPYLGAGKKTHKAIFANDITGGSLLFLVCNGREANTKSLSFYHVQLMPGFDYAAAPFVYESVAGGNFKSYDFIQYPATPAIDYTKGKLTGEITALSNSSEPSSNTRVYWAGFGGMAGSVAGTSNFTLSDGAHTATITVPYISGQTLSFAQEWGGTTMTNKELTSGQTATATFTSPIDSGPFVVGGDGSANYQSGFYTKNLKIK